MQIVNKIGAKILSLTVLLSLSLSACGADQNQRYAEAFENYRNGDFGTAIEQLESLSSEGNASAKSLLGVMFYNGNGVEANDDTAYRYFKEAAELGDTDAQFNLADIRLLHYPADHAP